MPQDDVDATRAAGPDGSDGGRGDPGAAEAAATAKIIRVNLHALVSGVAQHFLGRAAKKGIGIAVEVERDWEIQSDKEWLTLVLQNLVGNALKFSQRGTVRIRGGLRERRDGSRCVLSVSDQGPGIAKEDVVRIFKTFQRGQPHGQGGVGLGLAVAAQAAKLLGGELTVESEPGTGATFHLLLPLT